MPVRSGVYVIKCLQNSREYVGSSHDIARRWKEHRYDLRHNEHDNPHLQNAWSKYGEDEFEWRVVEETEYNDTLIREREKFWIDTLHPEFNISSEAYPTRLGAKNSEEHTEKFKISMKEAWAGKTADEREEWSRGLRRASEERKSSIPSEERHREAKRKYKAKKRAERAPEIEARKIERERGKAEWNAGKEAREMERRRKISEHNRGKTIPDDVREKIRQTVAERWQNDENYRERHQAATLEAMQDPEVLQRLSDSHKGIVHSEEHNAKISASGTGLKRSEETKRRLSEARKRMWVEKKANGTADAIRAKIADSKRGQKQSEETKAKKREAQRKRREKERLTLDTE